MFFFRIRNSKTSIHRSRIQVQFTPEQLQFIVYFVKSLPLINSVELSWIVSFANPFRDNEQKCNCFVATFPTVPTIYTYILFFFFIKRPPANLLHYNKFYLKVKFPQHLYLALMQLVSSHFFQQKKKITQQITNLKNISVLIIIIKVIIIIFIYDTTHYKSLH